MIEAMGVRQDPGTKRPTIEYADSTTADIPSVLSRSYTPLEPEETTCASSRGDTDWAQTYSQKSYDIKFAQPVRANTLKTRLAAAFSEGFEPNSGLVVGHLTNSNPVPQSGPDIHMRQVQQVHQVDALSADVHTRTNNRGEYTAAGAHTGPGTEIHDTASHLELDHAGRISGMNGELECVSAGTTGFKAGLISNHEAAWAGGQEQAEEHRLERSYVSGTISRIPIGDGLSGTYTPRRTDADCTETRPRNMQSNGPALEPQRTLKHPHENGTYEPACATIAENDLRADSVEPLAHQAGATSQCTTLWATNTVSSANRADDVEKDVTVSPTTHEGRAELGKTSVV